MNSIDFERSIGLIGEENFKLIQDKTICIIGLGGVGGTAFETLLRSGFKNFIIIDKDVVSASNLNRQVLFNPSDINLSKVECAKKFALNISKDLNIIAIDDDIKQYDLYNILKDNKVDMVVDAIDDVTGKVFIAAMCGVTGTPLIMSLGMANRLDPSKVELKRLDKTTYDPLARKLRHQIKCNGIDTKEIMTVCSKEEPIKDGNKLHSMMMVPSSAGLLIGYYVLTTIINQNK